MIFFKFYKAEKQSQRMGEGEKVINVNNVITCPTLLADLFRQKDKAVAALLAVTETMALVS